MAKARRSLVKRCDQRLPARAHHSQLKRLEARANATHADRAAYGGARRARAGAPTADSRARVVDLAPGAARAAVPGARAPCDGADQLPDG